MFRFAWLLLAFLSLMITGAVCQYRGLGRGAASNGSNAGHLQVHVVLDNGQPADQTQFHVELANGGGVPIGTAYTDTMGRASFDGLGGGTYTLRVSSPETEDTIVTFDMNGFESMHIEDVSVRARPGNPMGSPQGTVSAHELNIPDKARKEFDKGNAAVQHKDLESAREHFSRALESDPKFAAAGNNLGAICLQLKDYACARQALEQAVEADGHSGQALANLARLRMMEQNYTDAESLFHRSLALEPGNPATMTLMAETELVLHKFPDALEYARKVSEENLRGYELVHLIAGEALEAENKPQEAAAEYEQFLREAPDHPEAPRVEQALARLRTPGAENER